MDNIVTERENVTKFLGVLIEENLSWKQHINNVRIKISKSIGIPFKFRGIVQQRLLKQSEFFIHSLSFELCKHCVGKHL